MGKGTRMMLLSVVYGALAIYVSGIVLSHLCAYFDFYNTPEIKATISI